MIIPEIWLYRHDEIVTGRPYGCDVDEMGWLWEGCGNNRITGHSLRMAEAVQIPVPAMGNRPVYQVFAWEGKLLLTLGDCPFYLVYDPVHRTAVRRPIPASRPIVWYGTKTPNNKVILYERSESKALILDGPLAEPRVVACPFQGQLASGRPESDGLAYSTLSDPARVVRFDPEQERFIDEIPAPFPEANFSGRHAHGGILYFCDSARGRLVPLDMATRRWLDPIPTPDHGRIYGFLGGSFSLQSRSFICLSTYAHPSRLDPKTGKVIIPKGQITVDARPPRFLDRFLVFDAASQTFDYLVAPKQPDGVAQLCYSWADGTRFAITGMVIPVAKPGELGDQVGPWIVVQSEPAPEVPAFTFHDVHFDREEHLARCRRRYPAHHSIYLPEATWSPAIRNLSGPATQYPSGRESHLARRAARTDAAAYWAELAETITRGAETDADKVRRVAGFVRRALYYNPIQEPQVHHPIAVLESHDGRCGKGVAVTLAILQAIGIPARSVPFNHHVVAEATYGGGDHIVDALFFGANQPHRDGRVLSAAELKADPYWADQFPQSSIAYDPELLLSTDGFGVLGYVFGPWGSLPYYSYYLGAAEERPPTVPVMLPAERMGDDRIRIQWSKSVKWCGGDIEYDVRVFRDRACTERVRHVVLKGTSMVFQVPERNWMYFVEVRALDSHREKNPHTWYPAARSNFVLVPPEQYGWYGVL